MTRLFLASMAALSFMLSPVTASALTSDAPSLSQKLTSRQMLYAAGTAAVSVPAAFFGARLVGTLSSDLIGAVLPAVLIFALVPPAAVAFAASYGTDSSFWPAFGLGVATQVLAFTAATLLDISAMRPLALTLFMLVDAAALSLVTVSTTHFFAPEPREREAEVDRDRFSAPLATSGFRMVF